MKATGSTVLDDLEAAALYTLSVFVPQNRPETTLADGTQYEGEWRGDLCCGHGTATYTNGQVYIGEWVSGQRNGEGTHTWTSGRSYTGQWEADVAQGKGIQQWRDGRNYSGEWHNSMMHGEGLYTWPCGSVFEGQFCLGLRLGHGQLRHSDGTVFDGTWVEDVKSPVKGQGTITYVDGAKYTGEWRGTFRNGEGTMELGEDLVQGSWVNDTLQDANQKVPLGAARALQESELLRISIQEATKVQQGQCEDDAVVVVGPFGGLDKRTGKAIF